MGWDWIGRRQASQRKIQSSWSLPLISFGEWRLAYTPAALSTQWLLVLLQTASPLVWSPSPPQSHDSVGAVSHSPVGHRGGHVTKDDQSEPFLGIFHHLTKGRKSIPFFPDIKLGRHEWELASFQYHGKHWLARARLKSGEKRRWKWREAILMKPQVPVSSLPRPNRNLLLPPFG